MTKIFCDFCGKNLDGTVETLMLTTGHLDNPEAYKMFSGDILIDDEHYPNSTSYIDIEFETCMPCLINTLQLLKDLVKTKNEKQQ